MRVLFRSERGAQTVGGGELLMLALLLAVGGGLLWRFAGGPSAPMPTPEPALASPADSAPAPDPAAAAPPAKSIAVLPFENTSRRSEEHTSELPSLMRNSYAVFCLKQKKK